MIISNKAAKKARIHREVRSDAVLAKTTKMQVLMVFGFRVARSIVKPDCIAFAILHVVLLWPFIIDTSKIRPTLSTCIRGLATLLIRHLNFSLVSEGLRAGAEKILKTISGNEYSKKTCWPVLLTIWVILLIFIASASGYVSIDVIVLSSIVY